MTDSSPDGRQLQPSVRAGLGLTERAGHAAPPSRSASRWWRWETLFGAARVLSAMATESRVPSAVSHRSAAGVPWLAVVIISLAALCSTALCSLEVTATLSSLVFLLVHHLATHDPFVLGFLVGLFLLVTLDEVLFSRHLLSTSAGVVPVAAVPCLRVAVGVELIDRPVAVYQFSPRSSK